MKPLQQPMVQCLDLSRPESISTAGFCADVRSQAVKYPQPMLYSPAKGALVTYEPPGKTGLQDLQWLDNLSKPKQVTAKSFKAQPRSASPERQQQPQQQQLPQSQPPAQQQQERTGSSPPRAANSQQQQPKQQSEDLPKLPGHLRGLPPEAAAAVDRSSSTAHRAAAEAAFTAACQSERQLVSYPQAFSWGGRVKDKHSSLCRMNAGLQALGAGVVEPPSAELSTASTSGSNKQAAFSSSRSNDKLRAAAAAAGGAGGGGGAIQSSSSSVSVAAESSSAVIAVMQRYRPSRRKDAADAEAAAAAARVGAEADKLLNLLDRRKQAQEKQQQQKGHGAPKQRQQQQAQGAARSVAGRGAGAAHRVQDEPLCQAGLDYLQF